jgi:predicted O-linked N-acetylglucosamine transferase (SPINDLY family)
LSLGRAPRALRNYRHLDYIVADPVLIAATHRANYQAKAVWLPHSYLPHDETSHLRAAF